MQKREKKDTASPLACSDGSAAVNISSGGDCSDSSQDPLYLLRALVLLGPTVGLPISSARYVRAEQVLLAATRDGVQGEGKRR